MSSEKLYSDKFKKIVKTWIRQKRHTLIDKQGLVARMNILYPWIDSVINAVAIRSGKESLLFFAQDPNSIKKQIREEITHYKPYIMFCVKKMTENYISHNKSPRSDWQSIAVASLLLAWKAFSLDYDSGLWITVDMVSKYCDGGCPSSKLRSLERAIFKLEDYVIKCAPIGDLYHPAEGISLDDEL